MYSRERSMPNCRSQPEGLIRLILRSDRDRMNEFMLEKLV